MTAKEIVQELRKQPKYYAGITEQAYASKMITSIINGTSKPKTESEFLEKFGYVVNQERTYKKVKK